MRPLLFLIAFAAAAAFAADRPNLNGTWQLSSNHEERLKLETLLIQQTPDGVKISEFGAKEETVDIACGVDGHECKLKEGEISFWYNGPALVMMEMHHNRDVVTKTRLVLSEDGKTLNLEVIHVSPPGSSSTGSPARWAAGWWPAWDGSPRPPRSSSWPRPPACGASGVAPTPCAPPPGVPAS